MWPFDINFYLKLNMKWRHEAQKKDIFALCPLALPFDVNMSEAQMIPLEGAVGCGPFYI